MRSEQPSILQKEGVLGVASRMIGRKVQRLEVGLHQLEEAEDAVDFETLELVVWLEDERAAFVEALTDLFEGSGSEVGYKRVSKHSQLLRSLRSRSI